MSRTRLAALALIATMLAISGCGGSGSSGSLTRSELIARADLICRRVHARLASTTIKGPQSYARLLPPLASYEHAAVAELRKLTPPASMAGDWRQIVDGVQAFADATAKLGAYATSSGLPVTPSTRAASHAAGQSSQQIRAAAQRQGFKDCAVW
jgi:hypothetical protein